MKIVTIIGARPQFVKAAMLSKAIARHNALCSEEEIKEKILHTGQHYDYEMSEVFFQEMGIPAPAWNLGCTGRSEEMRDKILPILIQEKPDYVVVYGDTNSTAGGAMAAHEAGVRLVHIEAGLRSRNMEMPEERNRILTDKLATLLFCPTTTAVENLHQEGITKGVENVGDIMYDAALTMQGQGDGVIRELRIEKPYILATVHRAENADSETNMREILTAFRQIGQRIVWPMHPRTKKMIAASEMLTTLLQDAQNIQLIDNQGYREMAALEANAELILTDSGGVQKEAYFHGVPCVTMRNETEWVETVEKGWNQLTGADATRILAAVAAANHPNTTIEEYGDGHTAEKILQCLLAY